MSAYKFKIGEIVALRPAISRNLPGGAYEVIGQLPETGGEHEYRIKSANESEWREKASWIKHDRRRSQSASNPYFNGPRE
jgi:hypothetical protein